MPPELFLAVDGGQSRTLALLADADGRILGAGLSGPANHVHEPGGMARMDRALREAIGKAFQEAGLSLNRVRAACFGMTGGADVVAAVTHAFLDYDLIFAVEDSVTALAGASLAGPGIVVIAGTGAVAYGQVVNGRCAKSGGWGYIMGDEGSGYDIGIQTLRAVTQSADGRAPATLLETMVPAHFGLADITEVRAAVYDATIGRPQIAALAQTVAEAAVQGDDVARQILGRAGQDLARLAVAVLTRLDMLERGMSVFPTGGVFQAGTAVLEPFTAYLRQTSPETSVREPAFSPAIGALLMARQGAGYPIDELVLALIRETLPALAHSKTG